MQAKIINIDTLPENAQLTIAELETSTARNRKGITRLSASQIHKRVLFVIPDVMIKEVWNGFDPNKAANVLAGLNWLMRNKNRLKWQLAGKGWFYKFSHTMPPETETATTK